MEYVSMTQDKELFEGVFEDFKEEKQEKRERRGIIILSVICIFCVGPYLFFLLFGNNSWSALREIRKQKIELEERAQRLQKENVDLQKIIFELKGLEPAHEES